MTENNNHKQKQQQIRQSVVGMSKDKFNLLSEEAKTLITNCGGYRCLECVDETSYTPTAIMDYEINELYNNDIPDTLTVLYGHQSINVKEIDLWIKKELHTNSYNLIWLTSDPLDAIEYYSNAHKRFANLKGAINKNGQPIPVNEYKWTKNNRVLLISDCASDGQLIAYTGTLVAKEAN